MLHASSLFACKRGSWYCGSDSLPNRILIASCSEPRRCCDIGASAIVRLNYRIDVLQQRDFAEAAGFTRHSPVGSDTARPREFDTDAVREAAIRCFWTRGYEATSIKDLLAETGITAASLYNAFGDKATLFRTAFAHYVESGINARCGVSRRCRPGRQLQRLLADPEHKGCVVENSALKLAPHDARFRTVITEVFDRIESFFLRCVRASQADGTINAALGARNLARGLMAVLLGLRVLARVRPEKTLLEGTMAPVLALLEPDGPEASLRSVPIVIVPTRLV